MSRKIVSGDSELDRKVEAFLRRVPMTSVRGYAFEREAGLPATLTVKIFADITDLDETVEE